MFEKSSASNNLCSEGDHRQAFVLQLADYKLKALPREELRELLNEVQDPEDGSLDIRDLPDISELMEMDHEELLRLHQLCPFSQYFGQSSQKFNMKSCTFERAQMEALNMIRSSEASVTSLIPKVSSLKLQHKIDLGESMNDKGEPEAIEVRNDGLRQKHAIALYREDNGREIENADRQNVDLNNMQEEEKKEDKFFLSKEELREQMRPMPIEPKLEDQQVKFLMKHEIFQKLAQQRQQYLCH